jgi:GNAT superfamily N-acetyltransferase
VSIDVRRAEDPARYLATDQLVWFGEETPDDAHHLTGVPADQRFAVDLDDGPTETHAGLYGVRPMVMSLPGGSVPPVAGLTWVGVHPDCRRRGVLTAMLTDHLARTREEGLALSVLHASEPAIYGRFGYGIASLQLQVELGRGTTFTAPYLEDEAARVTTRLVTANQPGVTARVRACALAAAPSAAGTIMGTQEFADLFGHEPPEERRDKERKRFIFAQLDGEDLGCVGLRREHKWDNARPGGTLTAGLMFGTPAARLALLRRLVDFDLVGTVRLENTGAGDPLLAWLDGPRGTGDVKTWDSTWVRLVDIGAAWPLRSYDADCDVVVEVEDRHAPWNAGRWRLTASDGAGTAERSDAAAEVLLDVSVLGAAFLGRSVAGLLRAGRVREHRAGAFLELARAMRTDLEPESSMGF